MAPILYLRRRNRAQTGTLPAIGVVAEWLVRRTSGHRRRALGWMAPAAVACALALSSCGADDPESAPPPPTPSPSATETPVGPAVVFDGAVDVTPRRQVQAHCVGTGSPTVLLEVGGSGDMSDWPSSYVDALGAHTTTCLYSRAGGPGSTPVAHGQTRAQLVSDAYTLLDTLHRDHGVQGPYVFVGWSFGGSVALAEALEHPARTAGMVILDSNFPADFVPACIAQGHPAAECRATYDEDEEAKSIEKDIVAKVHPLPDIPIAVVTALQQPDCRLAEGEDHVSADIAGTDVIAPNCEALGIAIADRDRADWEQLGPQVTHTRIDADHEGLVSQALEQLTALVLDIVDAAR
ncbi:pimeloyl-ACP methyl ester carboxylesterase [Marmoricola sp. URHA0025 HA25]